MKPEVPIADMKAMGRRDIETQSYLSVRQNLRCGVIDLATGCIGTLHYNIIYLTQRAPRSLPASGLPGWQEILASQENLNGFHGLSTCPQYIVSWGCRRHLTLFEKSLTS